MVGKNTELTGTGGALPAASAPPIAHELSGWYIRELEGHGQQLWSFTETSATRADITNAEAGPGTHFVAKEGETVWDTISRQTPWLEDVAPPGPFVRMTNQPNNFFPRMARPLALTMEPKLWLPKFEDEQYYVTEAKSQLVALVRQLQAVARVVQPSPGTLDAYGHEIRNLLILTATEVEMHLRGILRAHGVQKSQLSTNDFVKLAGLMRLGDYCVHFHPYPDIEPIAPFTDWTPARPSQSLGWYAAYNGVKHNREQEFDRATLGAALTGVAACSVLMVAQFGSDALGNSVSDVLSIKPPRWALEDMYYAEPGEGDWFTTPHPGLS